MPKDVISRLSQSDRNKMFIEWLSREPTPTGWFFTKTVIAALGEDFINYLFEKVDEGMNSDGTEVTRDGMLLLQISTSCMSMWSSIMKSTLKSRIRGQPPLRLNPGIQRLEGL